MLVRRLGQRRIPTKGTPDPQEDRIQRLRPEDCSVGELVAARPSDTSDRAVHPQRRGESNPDLPNEKVMSDKSRASK